MGWEAECGGNSAGVCRPEFAFRLKENGKA